MRRASLRFLLAFVSCALASPPHQGAAVRERFVPVAGYGGAGLREAERLGTDGKAGFDFAVNFSVGLASYEDSAGTPCSYQRFGVFPEFVYGRWGLGLDLSVELDGEFRLRDLDCDGHPDRWTTLHDYLTRVRFLGYGRKGEPLYGRIGAVESATLGHGLVMDRYANTMVLPQAIQLGLTLDLDGALFSYPYLGFEAVADDVLDWDVIAARVYARPLAKSENPRFRKLEVGGMYAADLDPLENPLDAPGDGAAGDGPSVFGLDVELPLIEREHAGLVAYADWAAIAGRGSGALAGCTFTRRGLALTGQLRLLGRGFTPSYFDSFYEKDRPYKRASLAAYDRFAVGYLLESAMSVFDAASVTFGFADVVGGPEGPHVLAAFGTSEKAFRRFGAALTFEKKDIETLSEVFAKDDSLIRFTLGYEVGAAAKLVLTFVRGYAPYSFPAFASADRASIETSFSF